MTGGDLGNTILISSEAMGSPVNNNGISAQSFSETINIGDTGDTGDYFQNSLEVSSENSSSLSSKENSIPCHYCNFTSNTEKEVERHSVISHPGKIARPI